MTNLKPTLWKRLSPRGRRWLLGAAIAFVAYSLIGFFAVPALLKWQLVKQLPTATKRQAAVRQVRFNPWALSLSIRGLELTEPDGRRFLSWEEFYVNFQASSLFRWQWTFADIRLVDLFAELILFRDGRLNLANMFEPAPGAPPPPPASEASSTPPRIGIHSLAITNGFVAFEDQTLQNPFRTEYRPINVRLTRFTTRPDADTPYSFAAEGDSGRRVTWSGNLTVEPLRSDGQIEIAGVDLARFQPYFDDFMKARLTNGLVDLELAYHFEIGTNGTDLLVTNLALHAKAIALEDPTRKETVVSLAGFEVADSGLDLRARSVRLGSVKVLEGGISARLERDSGLNLVRLFAPPVSPTNTPSPPRPDPDSTTPSPWTLDVGEFGIAQTRIAFEDLTLPTPFQAVFEPIQIGLTNLTTRPGHDARYSVRIASELAKGLTAEGLISLDPVRSAGTVTLAAAQLAKSQPYLEGRFRGLVNAGTVDLTLPYRMALSSNAVVAAVSNVIIRVNDLEVNGADTNETVLAVADLALEAVDANLSEQRARVGRVKASGGSVLVRRLEDGSVNLLELMVASTNATPQASPPPANLDPDSAESGWKLAVDEVQMSDYTLRFEDQQPPRPATFTLESFTLGLRGFTTDGNPPIASDLAFRLNEKGALASRGTITLRPISAEIETGIAGLELGAFQPYLEPHVGLRLVSGSLGTTNRIRLSTAGAGTPRLSLAGDLWLGDFGTTDPVAHEELVRWDALILSGIDLSLEPNALKLTEAKWQGLQANLVILPDGQLNMASAFRPPDASTPTDPAPVATPPPATERAEGFPVSVEALVLENVGISFTDQSLTPAAAFSLDGVTGSVRGLSSELNTTAEVALEGQVDKQAPFGIKGRLNPLATEPFVDLELTNRTTQLAAFTPYTEKYLGHPLNKGRLSMDLKYQIQGAQLKAENHFEIDQLMLGPRNQSPDATSLPVKLGVALLKDASGRIELDVPVEGRLDDPEFRLAGAVVKVISNLILKAAASPFSLLGKLVGGGEELSFLDFEPGTTNLVEGEVTKLDKLARALTERPALNLEIEGRADPVRDRNALALVRLQQQLRARHLAMQSAKDRAEGSGEPGELDPEIYAGLLRATFIETFGTNFTAMLQTNALTAAATNWAGASSSREPSDHRQPQRKKRRGFLGLGLFGGGPALKPSAAEKELNKRERALLDELDPEVMEALLVGRTEVPADELRQLMAARARWVQDRLIESGAVTADRLFLVAPKSLPAGAAGQARVELSLN